MQERQTVSNRKHTKFIVVQSTPAPTSTTQGLTWDFHYILPEYSRVVFPGLQLKPNMIFQSPNNQSWFYTG